MNTRFYYEIGSRFDIYYISFNKGSFIWVLLEGLRFLFILVISLVVILSVDVMVLDRFVYCGIRKNDVEG